MKRGEIGFCLNMNLHYMMKNSLKKESDSICLLSALL